MMLLTCSSGGVHHGVHVVRVTPSIPAENKTWQSHVEGKSFVEEFSSLIDTVGHLYISLRPSLRLYHTTPQPFYGPFFRNHPGDPVPEENFWTLWCKGRLTEADTPTIRLGATPSGLTSAHLHHPPTFYRPDALPATHPTVSKH